MNILYIANSLSMYGANKSLMEMAEVFAKNNNVYIAMPSYGEIYETALKKGIIPVIIPYAYCAKKESDLTISDFFYIYYNYLLALLYLKKIKKLDIDIIHSNASNVDFGAMVSNIIKVPHIWHIREMLYEDYKLKYINPFFVNQCMLKANKIIYISEFIRKSRIIKGIDNGIVLYNGIDIDNYRSDVDRKFEENQYKLLFTGSIREEKGVIDAILAVQQLVKNGKNVKLTIAGSPSAYWEDMKKLINDSDLNDYIDYVGSKSDLKTIREKSDIAIMASRSEAFGRVTIEAMLSNMLVIGANAGGTKELIVEDETGYLYEPGNIEELVQKINYAYSNKEHIKKIINNGQRWAENNFSSRIYAEKIMKLYEEEVICKS